MSRLTVHRADAAHDPTADAAPVEAVRRQADAEPAPALRLLAQLLLDMGERDRQAGKAVPS